MFFTDKAAKETIATLKSRITELEEDLTYKDSLIESQNVTINDQTAELAEAQNKLTELANVSKKINELENQIIAKDEEIQSAKESSNVIAIETLASIGQNTPIEIGEDSEAKTKEEFLTEYNKLNKTNPAEATNYFRANASKHGIKI